MLPSFLHLCVLLGGILITTSHPPEFRALDYLLLDSDRTAECCVFKLRLVCSYDVVCSRLWTFILLLESSSEFYASEFWAFDLLPSHMSDTLFLQNSASEPRAFILLLKCSSNA